MWFGYHKWFTHRQGEAPDGRNPPQTRRRVKKHMLNTSGPISDGRRTDRFGTLDGNSIVQTLSQPEFVWRGRATPIGGIGCMAQGRSIGSDRHGTKKSFTTGYPYGLFPLRNNGGALSRRARARWNMSWSSQSLTSSERGDMWYLDR
jgi:hypothetical protein